MVFFARLRGFTLIEMLIAITLLSIMVLLIFSSLKLAADSWNAGEERTLTTNKKAVVYQFFKRHLTTIRPMLTPINPQAITDGTTQQPVFLGSPQRLRFVASLPLSSLRKGLQVFDIFPNENNPQQIMVALTPYQQFYSGHADKALLIDHVKTLMFSFYGRRDAESPSTWQVDWIGTDSLPSLIKVSILLEDNSFWPDMIIPLKITSQFTPSVVAPDVPLSP